MAALPAGGLLDWSDRSHWHNDARPCRSCGGATNLRDDHGHPLHKTCAEAELTDVDDIVRRYSDPSRR